MRFVCAAVRRTVSLCRDRILHWDRRIVHAIGDSQRMSRLERLFMAVTTLGDGYIWAILALGMLILGGRADRLNVAIGTVVTVTNIAIFRTIKKHAARGRPETNAVPRLRTRIDGFSFPSGHATTAFGLAWIVSNSYPSLGVRLSIYFVAATIALSRVIVREHYPLDILGGAMLGSAIAAALFPLLTYLLF